MKTVEFIVRFTAQVSNDITENDISDAYINLPLANVDASFPAKFIEYETMDVEILSD
jgi:hypothetical protein